MPPPTLYFSYTKISTFGGPVIIRIYCLLLFAKSHVMTQLQSAGARRRKDRAWLTLHLCTAALMSPGTERTDLTVNTPANILNPAIFLILP